MTTDSKTIKTTVTPEEGFWLGVLRLNRAERKIEIARNWQVGRLRIRFLWRSRKNLWGRFGGGWNWHIGVQVGSTTINVYLLVAMVSASWTKAAPLDAPPPPK